MVFHRFSTALFATLLAAASTAGERQEPVQAAGGDLAFRVRPYVQNPAPDGMTLTWFSRSPNPGTVRLLPRTGRLSVPRTTVSSPQAAPELAYHPLEAALLPDGAPVSPPYRHEVRLEGLSAGTRYEYRVFQDGEEAGGRFRTPRAGDTPLRFIVYADSETEPESTGKPAAWPGTDPATAERVYPVDQSTGYRENLAVIAARRPDFVAIAGDLVQSGGEQRDWDEFWRHNGELAASVPIFPALGNHEYFGGPGGLGKYANPDSERAVAKYLAYFDLPGNGAAAHRERYYSVTIGPVTLVVLDGNDAHPHRSVHDPNWRLQGEQAGEAAPDWRPGSAQFRWLEGELAKAQAGSRFTFVMFHNCPYSSGVHGQIPGEGEGQDILSGVPLRELSPLFLRRGVDALLTGHDEMYEHSVLYGAEVLADGSEVPQELHVYDVGVGGDGLRGPVPGVENPARVFLAHTDAPEIWSDDGALLDGGKHYGHLEVNIERNAGGSWQARLDMVYLFPVAGPGGAVERFERRVYADSVILAGDRRDQAAPR